VSDTRATNSSPPATSPPTLEEATAVADNFRLHGSFSMGETPTTPSRPPPRWLKDVRVCDDAGGGYCVVALVTDAAVKNEKSVLPRVMRVGPNSRMRLLLHDVASFVAPMRDVGFWWSEREPWFPHPRDFIDPSWSAAEREAVVEHLTHRGKRAAQYLGFASCRLCDVTLGTTDQTDGTYYWPERLEHYLQAHDVKLPEHFVAHVLATAAAATTAAPALVSSTTKD
jgi:hypothetical protein